MFISYARADNTVPYGVEKAHGFVTLLHGNLKRSLIPLGQPRISFFLDTRNIDEGAQWRAEAESSMKSADMLLVVLTEAWLRSKNCQYEDEIFRKRWQHEGADLNRRIVVVRPTFVPRTKWPQHFDGQKGYTFYTTLNDEEGEREEPYFTHAGKPKDEFFDVVDRMAKFVHKIAEVSVVDPVPAAPPRDAGRVVYVALPSADMRREYDKIVAELQREGLTVVPDQGVPVPQDSTAVDFFKAALDKASASIHLIGRMKGFTPDGTETPIGPLQMQLARARLEGATPELSSGSGFVRLIFAPKVFPDPNNPEAATEERVPTDVREAFDAGVDSDKLFCTGINDFVVDLKDYLKQTKPAPPPLPLGAIKRGSKVFVDFDPIDQDSVIDLADVLAECGVTLAYAALEDSRIKNKVVNRERLRNCDAVVMLWGKSTDTWLVGQAMQLDMQELGRTKPFAARAAVAVKPSRPVKKMYSKRPPDSLDRVLDLTDKERPQADDLRDLIDPTES